jgi:hypothetical protein
VLQQLFGEYSERIDGVERRARAASEYERRRRALLRNDATLRDLTHVVRDAERQARAARHTLLRTWATSERRRWREDAEVQVLKRLYKNDRARYARRRRELHRRLAEQLGAPPSPRSP